MFRGAMGGTVVDLEFSPELGCLDVHFHEDNFSGTIDSSRVTAEATVHNSKPRAL
jgi:hypothetical protein